MELLHVSHLQEASELGGVHNARKVGSIDFQQICYFHVPLVIFQLSTARLRKTIPASLFSLRRRNDVAFGRIPPLTEQRASREELVGQVPCQQLIRLVDWLGLGRLG